MFSTFQGFAPKDSEIPDRQDSPPKTRPKRAQVQRACNACRLNRTKCDSGRPCRNCKDHNRRCIDAPIEIRSLAAATEEIERLRVRISELEGRLSISPSREQDGELQTVSGNYPPSKWRGIFIDDAYYGVSSLAYFLDRMYSYMHPVLRPPILSFTPDDALRFPPVVTPDNRVPICTRSQQDYLLDLYWLWSHPIYPIINEAEFRQTYESLWVDPGSATRRPSALVDIVLALCIQFSSCYLTRTSEKTMNLPHDNEASISGYTYYESCHKILDQRRGDPDLSTVQCYILSCIYLLNAGFDNRAQVILAQAIRAATISGLDQEPRADESEQTKELHRRIWWTLYILDTHTSMDLGRSFLVSSSMARCGRPSISPTVAAALGPNYTSSDPEISWLAYHDQTLRLTWIARSILEGLFAKCSEIFAEANVTDLYEDAATRETCARYLIDRMRELTKWVEELPSALKTPRRFGKPFSTDRTQLDIDTGIPVWLQRQRIILELQYHHICSVLYRIFICFSPTPSYGTPSGDSNCIAGLGHAIATTNIVYQILNKHDLLSGCYQAFYWQKSATMLAIGFACGYPVCPPTPAAKKAAKTAKKVFDMYGPNLWAARVESDSTSQLLDTAEAILDRFMKGVNGAGAQQVSALLDVTGEDTPASRTPSSDDSFGVPPGVDFMAEGLWFNTMDHTIHEAYFRGLEADMADDVEIEMTGGGMQPSPQSDEPDRQTIPDHYARA